MSSNIIFTSRTGNLLCSKEEVFGFLTDFRNMKQFITGGDINILQIDKEYGIFNIRPAGDIEIKLSEKEPFRRVIYAGTALKSNNFSLFLEISENETARADVKIVLNAEMNPILRMVAAGHVERFLETLIDEMEKFKGWCTNSA